jgi:DNA-binding PadR family transcriptional regulator
MRLLSGTGEIQEAIVQLTPDEQEMLRDWLSSLDAERERRWAEVALERLQAIRAGEPTLEADEVFVEARRLVAE